MQEIKITKVNPPLKITIEGGAISPEGVERIKAIFEKDEDEPGEKTAMLDPRVCVVKAEPKK